MRRSQRNGIFWENAQAWDFSKHNTVFDAEEHMSKTDTEMSGPATTISNIIAWTIVWAIVISLGTLMAKGVYVLVPTIWNLF